MILAHEEFLMLITYQNHVEGFLLGRSPSAYPYALANWQCVASPNHATVIRTAVIYVADDHAAYEQYCLEYRQSRPDWQLPTLEQLAEFVEYQCPSKAITDANERLNASFNKPLTVTTAAFHSEGEGTLSDLKPKTICATAYNGQRMEAISLAETLQGFDEARQANSEVRLNPLAPLVRAWHDRYRPPDQVQVLTAGKARLTRMPNEMATVALADWEDMPVQAETPELNLLMATVDGLPVASVTADKPEFRKPRRPRRPTGKQLPLFDLPGNRDAEGLVLLLMRTLEREVLQENGEIDRRNPIHADVFFTLSLACAMTRPLTVSLDTYGAWLTGRYTTTGIKGAEKNLLRRRAFRALDWARGWVMTKRGFPMALLDVSTVGLLEGRVELRPWGWGLANGTASVGWRLTGAVANAATRAAAASDGRTGTPSHSRAGGYGTFGRIVAALDDFIGASGRASKTDSRDRLLVPTRPGGPGPEGFISAAHLMARAGLVWDPADKCQSDRMRQLWRSIVERFDHGGYLLGSSPLAEAQAGDTIEIIEVVQGSNKSRPGGIRFQASSRFVEAYAKTKGKNNGGGLDRTPLPRLFEGRR